MIDFHCHGIFDGALCKGDSYQGCGVPIDWGVGRMLAKGNNGQQIMKRQQDHVSPDILPILSSNANGFALFFGLGAQVAKDYKKESFCFFI